MLQLRQVIAPTLSADVRAVDNTSHLAREIPLDTEQGVIDTCSTCMAGSLHRNFASADTPHGYSERRRARATGMSERPALRNGEQARE
jgi:hypothetical protein